MAIITAYPEDTPVVSVRFQKGFKTDLHWYEAPIAMFAERFGHTTTVRNLIDPGAKLDFMDEDQDRTEEFFTFPFSEEETDTPKVAGVHSLSAYFLSKMLMDDEKAEAFAAQGYEAIFMFNPHLGNKHHDSIGRRAYSEVNKGRAAGTTPFERAFMKRPIISQGDGYMGYDNPPSHGQGLLFWKEGKKLIKKLEEQGGFSDAVSHIPIFVIRGSADDVNSKKKEKRFAAAIGAESIKFSTGHNAYLSCTEAQSWFAYKVAKVTGTTFPYQRFSDQCENAFEFG